jgi:hypothetical protein
MSRWYLALSIMIALSIEPLFGQNQPSDGARRTPLRISGNVRTRLEAWDWFDGNADSAYPFSGSTLRLSFAQQRQNLDWQFELAAPILLGLPENAVASGVQGQLGLGATYYVANDRSRNAAMVFAKQAFIRFKNLGGDSAQSLRLGRMEFVDATEVTPANATLAAVKRDRLAHRLIGHFGWTHIGRSFDGVHYSYNTPANNLTLFGARPTRGVFQVDGWGELNIALGYAAYTRQLGSKASAGELRLFGIYYDDWRKNIVKTDNRPLAVRRADQEAVRLGTLGAHYIHAFEAKSGTADLLLWGAFQAGSWGVQSHRAGAMAIEAGFQPAIWHKVKPWFRGGYQYGSGDGNPDDGTHRSFFQILPTPRWLARFPFYNLINIEDAFAEVILRPGSRLNVRGEVHSLRTANEADLWYQGGGAFQPWTFGYVGRASGGKRGMATMADISADYQINRKLSLGAYFANVWGRDLIEGIYPGDKNALLGYLELTCRF